MWHKYFIFYDLHKNHDKNSNLPHLLMGDTIHLQQQKKSKPKKHKAKPNKNCAKKNLHNIKKTETLKFMVFGILNH